MVGNVAFRGAGGAAKEAAIEAAETQRMVMGQGYPGGAKIDLGGAGPTGNPSQVGEVIGNFIGALTGPAQSTMRPTSCRATHLAGNKCE